MIFSFSKEYLSRIKFSVLLELYYSERCGICQQCLHCFRHFVIDVFNNATDLHSTCRLFYYVTWMSTQTINTLVQDNIFKHVYQRDNLMNIESGYYKGFRALVIARDNSRMNVCLATCFHNAWPRE